MDQRTTNKETVTTKKKRQAKTRAFKDLEGKFLHIMVGDRDRPAGDTDIKDIESRINNLLKENDINCLVFVTHHAVAMELIETRK